MTTMTPMIVNRLMIFPPAFINSSRREPTRLVDLGPTGVWDGDRQALEVRRWKTAAATTSTNCRKLNGFLMNAKNPSGMVM